MEEKTNKEVQKEYIFNAVCFSTNYKNLSSIKIINQYLMNVDGLDINRRDENNVIFKKKLKIGDKTEIECMNKFFEVSPMKSVKLKDENDCFIIFLDLEYDDSLGELNKNLKNIAKINGNDKYLYIINFYMEENEIKKSLNSDNIKPIVDRNGFTNFDIMQINLNSPDEIIKAIDKIIFETLQNKKLLDLDFIESSVDKSNSIFCIIN